MHQNNPLEMLNQIGAAEVSRRASAREANRARFPEIAMLTDAIGPHAKLVWARDENGEIGKIPKDPASWCWIENIPPPYEHPKGKRL